LTWIFGKIGPLAAVTMVLTGCGSSSTLRTYVLGDAPQPGLAIRAESGLPVVELRTVTVPDYLDSSDILRRVGPNEVAPSPTGRWGDRLSVGITGALAASLAKRLPNEVITTTPTGEPGRRLLVDVESFEIAADGRCRLAARWWITGGGTQEVRASADGSFGEPADGIDDAAVAAAMSRAIDGLADRIVISLAKG
jgi:uncharacterized lipoprotein YmbA